MPYNLQKERVVLEATHSYILTIFKCRGDVVRTLVELSNTPLKNNSVYGSVPKKKKKINIRDTEMKVRIDCAPRRSFT